MAAACFRARLAREPNPAGERSGRVLVGDRGRGQSRAFGVADLAAVLATCHRPRGVAADRLALERGRLDAVIARLLFHGRDAPEVSALRWPPAPAVADAPSAPSPAGRKPRSPGAATSARQPAPSARAAGESWR